MNPQAAPFSLADSQTEIKKTQPHTQQHVGISGSSAGDAEPRWLPHLDSCFVAAPTATNSFEPNAGQEVWHPSIRAHATMLTVDTSIAGDMTSYGLGRLNSPALVATSEAVYTHTDMDAFALMTAQQNDAEFLKQQATIAAQQRANDAIQQRLQKLEQQFERSAAQRCEAQKVWRKTWI